MATGWVHFTRICEPVCEILCEVTYPSCELKFIDAVKGAIAEASEVAGVREEKLKKAITVYRETYGGLPAVSDHDLELLFDAVVAYSQHFTSMQKLMNRVR